MYLFGASTSPGCANFALKQTASDNPAHCGPHVTELLQHAFYVLKRCETTEESSSLVKFSVAICSVGGIQLQKFVSNSGVVLRVRYQSKTRLRSLSNMTLCLHMHKLREFSESSGASSLIHLDTRSSWKTEPNSIFKAFHTSREAYCTDALSRRIWLRQSIARRYSE